MMDRLYFEKLEQAAGLLAENNIDLWLIYSSEGSDPAVALATGLKTIGKTFFIVTKEGKRYAIASIIDALESENSNLFDEVRRYTANPEETLRALLEELKPQTIAVNYSEDDNLCDGLTVGRYRWLKKAAGETYAKRFVKSEVFLTKLRSIKSKSEVEKIQKAIDITLEIYDEVFVQLRAGLTEYQVGELFLESMRKRGVVEGNSRLLEMPMILKERIAHRQPGTAVIQKGDFLIIDYSIDYEGYVSDIARTLYFLKDGETEAPAVMQERFAAAHGAITLVKESIKPGMKGHELDSLARNHLLNCGMPEITHATGHQVGRCTHDGGALLGPCWERYGNAPHMEVEEGNVFTIEPTILFTDGDYSILTEEIIRVGHEGATFLSRRQEAIILIP